ncbi:thioredoxin [Fomitiporia mediterranea MF3/22]|uniref:thioredoxin n=1 Tax=Fomitiporia mediterranea (strain MF3/22) TaxID=694068 RepID=UPI0004409212|nr:thioredoxin [Fomitiporia mediterranea MF3/22]EJC98765.1 thioredoxin [Fomitiporia mediterranea MF3/22]
MGGVTPVETLQQFQEIINKDKYTVFDFWATWCGPCRMISPIFEKLAESAGDEIEFYKVDVDSAPDIAQEVGIKAMPTFILFKNGQKVDDLMGAHPGKLNELIAKSKQ